MTELKRINVSKQDLAIVHAMLRKLPGTGIELSEAAAIGTVRYLLETLVTEEQANVQTY